MEFDFQKRYPSNRNLVYARNGMVATSEPLAASGGIEILKAGGNAIDAAIAVAALLTVVEPTSNGIGGDAFALVWVNNKLHGLNSSGYAPKAIDGKDLVEKGLKEVPNYGLTPVTVPGAPAAWAELSKRFGKLPLSEVLKPAIRAAREGYALSPTVASGWQRAFQIYKEKLQGEIFEEWFKTFAQEGCAPKAGEIVKLPNHGDTIEEIGKTMGESFYRGDIAREIDALSKRYGGYITYEDMSDYRPLWVEPISSNYRGYEVCEIPPNGQGIAALMALNIFENFDPKEKDSPDTIHKLIESMKLAFEDTKAYVADPMYMKTSFEDLLDKDYAKLRASLIGDKAIKPEPGSLPQGGTVYLCSTDSEGNMVSYIQSNYKGFGSGVVVPGRGIALHNRGNNFSLDINHPNFLQGGKRPYHTIIPGFLLKDGMAVGPFGVMGGFMQPQGHLQVITSTIDFMLNPQDALDAPRWQWMSGKKVLVEQSMDRRLIMALKDMGHEVSVDLDSGNFGRGQIIWRTEEGTYVGGTESRCDGYIGVY